MLLDSECEARSGRQCREAETATPNAALPERARPLAIEVDLPPWAGVAPRTRKEAHTGPIDLAGERTRNRLTAMALELLKAPIKLRNHRGYLH